MSNEDPLSPIPNGRLSRWSERKQLAREKGQVSQPENHQKPENTSEDLPLTETTERPNLPVDSVAESEEVLLTDEDMPALESIDSKSDISCFFNKGVSEKLRQTAIQRLLRLPAFNITDGLNDYDEDYTTFEPLGDIVTSDMRFHSERKARLAAEEEAARLAESSDTSHESDKSDVNEESVEQAETENDETVEAQQTQENAAAQSGDDTQSAEQQNVESMDDVTMQPSDKSVGNPKTDKAAT